MDWSIDRDADASIQDQVEELLRNLIAQDEYRRGKLLPGETEIAEQLDISRNTVREGMSRLVEDGLIIRQKGIGSFVDRGEVDTNLRSWLDISGEIEDKADSTQEYENELTWVLPPEIVVNVFDVDPHVQLPKLKRVLGDDAGPLALVVSYFHPRIGLEKDESFEGKLYEDVLEPKYGVSPQTSDEEIETEMPDKDIKKTLELERKIPVLYRERIISDENGDSLEINECYFRGDRFRFTIKMTRDEAMI